MAPRQTVRVGRRFHGRVRASAEQGNWGLESEDSAAAVVAVAVDVVACGLGSDGSQTGFLLRRGRRRGGR